MDCRLLAASSAGSSKSALISLKRLTNISSVMSFVNSTLNFLQTAKNKSTNFRVCFDTSMDYSSISSSIMEMVCSLFFNMSIASFDSEAILSLQLAMLSINSLFAVSISLTYFCLSSAISYCYSFWICLRSSLTLLFNNISEAYSADGTFFSGYKVDYFCGSLLLSVIFTSISVAFYGSVWAYSCLSFEFSPYWWISCYLSDSGYCI